MQMIQNRRTLHQPFFPLSSPPPTSQPTPSPPFPKYPFSTNPQQPFFPDYPSPPSSGAASVPTFPANISSLIYPTSSHPAPHPSPHSRLLPAILFSLIALSLLALSAAFLFHRRRRRLLLDPIPESNNKLPSPHPPPATSPGLPSSEFLYLGTLVNSTTTTENQAAAPAPAPAPTIANNSSVPAAKLGSPELTPLPPLSRSVRTNYGNATAAAATDSDDEFYSPKGSESRSRAEAAEDEKCGSRSSDSSTPSYPDSNSDGSASPIGSSPGKSEDSRSGTPPPPPPPPSMRPLTPSPPKRKPPSPSPLSSPIEKSSRVSVRSAAKFKESDGNLRKHEFSGQNSRNQASVPAPAAPPPPPPPPPPPAGYWESQVRKPPAVATPKSVASKRPVVVEFAENSDSVEKSEETTPRPKLKPLHWDKVRASSDRVMVWDQLKSSSFQVNEEMIETLFGCNKANAAPKETNKQHPVLPSPRMENRVLDPKKSQNIAILLRALNVTKEEVCEALSEGHTESLGTELLETLLKMAPTKAEELKLKEHRDDSPFKLGPAEKFLKAVLDIPFAFKRVEAMLYITNFDSEVSYLKNSFETLEAACEELRNSRLFLKLLEAVLKTGNRMNVGTNRGDAHAFKLDTLLKLVDVKGTDGKTTLLHFVVQEIIRTEGSRLSSAKTQANALQNDLECKKRGLQVVAGLGGELANVKKAAAMDSEVLSSYVSKLAGGIGKIADVLRWNEASNSNISSKQFQEAMSGFLKKAEDQIIKVQAQESVALSLVKEITEYFHGNSAKEEAHPFRIFMVVRDFLSILDQVCKEVGKINELSIASSVRQFPVPVNPTLIPLAPKIQALRTESSDDESLSSSS